MGLEEIITLHFQNGIRLYMNRIFPFFFLLIMALNVTLPVVEQLWGGDTYELAKLGKGEEGKTEKESEKETEKEKEALAFSDHAAPKLDAFSLKKFRRSLFSTTDFPASERYVLLPELPPDA